MFRVRVFFFFVFFTEHLYDIHCIDSIHSKQLCVVRQFKVLCRAVVSLQFCFEIYMDNCVIDL